MNIAPKTCIMMYGKFSPVHMGHGKMFQHAQALKQSIPNSEIKLYVTNSEQLPYDFKIGMIDEYYPWVMKYFQPHHASTLFGVLEELDPLYSNIVMVCGSDRAGKFSDLLHKYNGELYNFDTVQTVSAGPRENNPYSSTNVRDTILRNDFAEFCSLMPPGSYGKNRTYFELLKQLLGEKYGF